MPCMQDGEGRASQREDESQIRTVCAHWFSSQHTQNFGSIALPCPCLTGKFVPFFFPPTLQDGVLLEIPVGKPQIEKPSLLLGSRLGRGALPWQNYTNISRAQLPAPAELPAGALQPNRFHPNRYLGRGLITPNDSVAIAMAKSSVILPWPGRPCLLGTTCSL